MRKALEEAAIALSWPGGVAWGGPHVLRVGGITQLKKKVADVVMSMFSGHRSVAVARHYARSNAARKGSKKA
jgi:hypothetical protein